MRVLIIGNLAGQLSAATKIAFDRGAKVLHAHDADAAMDMLRTGRGADIVMIDVHEDIRSLVAAMKQERIVAPVVACGIGANPERPRTPSAPARASSSRCRPIRN
jgi:two-component system response regulator FlrC